MESKILSFCRENGLCPGQTLLLAVSGGRDSMAMLHFFATNWDKSCLAVGHFDHQSRQGQSTQDAEFVEKSVKAMGLDFYLGTARVEAEAKSKKQGFEAMARQLRYDFLEKTAESCQADWILTAHQAEDNVETLLLHLCRGAGLSGLSGIPPVRGKIGRPLLSVTRREIGDYVAENAVDFVEDETNQDETYRRNYVRHGILPKLEELNPQYLNQVNNTMSIIRQESDFLDSYVENLVPIQVEEGFRLVKKSDFQGIPPGLRGRWLPFFTNSPLPSYKLRQGLLAEMEGDSYGGYLLYDEKTGRILRDFPMNPPVNQKIPLDSPFVWGKWWLSLSEEVYEGSCPEGSFFLQQGEGLFLRTRQEGDRIQVAGRAHYSLKKYLQQEKIPPWERDFLPIFCDAQGNLLAVGLLAIGEQALPQVGQMAWKIKLRKEDRLKRKKRG